MQCQTQQAGTTRSTQQAGVDGGPSDSNVETRGTTNEGSLLNYTHAQPRERTDLDSVSSNDLLLTKVRGEVTPGRVSSIGKGGEDSIVVCNGIANAIRMDTMNIVLNLGVGTSN